MFIEYEIVDYDPGTSFRLLHQKVKPSNFVWQYHYHPEVELVCVTDGSGVRHVGHHLGRYESGDLILIGSNVPHAGFGLNASVPHEEIVIQMPNTLLNDSINSLKELSQCRQLLQRAKYGLSFYGETYEQIKQEMIALLEMPLKKRIFHVFSIFQFLAKSTEYEQLNDNLIATKKLMHKKGRLQKILTYIEEHFAEEIDIQEIAAKVGLSIPSFSAYFKRTTSVTFTDFVNNFRIQKACYYLYEGYNVSETAYKCGYNSPSYFIRVFKKLMGESPKQYMQQREKLNERNKPT